jgi:hypothetical protein
MSLVVSTAGLGSTKAMGSAKAARAASPEIEEIFKASGVKLHLESVAAHAAGEPMKPGAGIGTSTRAGATLQALLAVLVVDCALLRVAQHLVGVGDVLKLFFMPLVFIRVVKLNETAVFLFQDAFVGISRNTEDIIEVTAGPGDEHQSGQKDNNQACANRKTCHRQLQSREESRPSTLVGSRKSRLGLSKERRAVR